MKKLFKVNAPDGTQLTRSSEKDYTHAVICQFSDRGYFATFHKSLENAVKVYNTRTNDGATNPEWNVTYREIQPVEIIEKKSLPKKRTFKVKTPNGFTKTTSSLKEVYTHAVITSHYPVDQPIASKENNHYGLYSESCRYGAYFYKSLEEAEAYKKHALTPCEWSSIPAYCEIVEVK